MRDFIATDGDGNVVGKWRRHSQPDIPSDYNLEEVEDVTGYSVDYWYNDDDAE